MRELNQNELGNVGGGLLLLGFAIATLSAYKTLQKIQQYDWYAYSHNFADYDGVVLPRVPLFAHRDYYAAGWPTHPAFR